MYFLYRALMRLSWAIEQAIHLPPRKAKNAMQISVHAETARHTATDLGRSDLVIGGMNRTQEMVASRVRWAYLRPTTHSVAR